MTVTRSGMPRVQGARLTGSLDAKWISHRIDYGFTPGRSREKYKIRKQIAADWLLHYNGRPETPCFPTAVRFDSNVVRPRKKGNGAQIMMRRKSGEKQPIRVLLEFFFLFFSSSFPLSCHVSSAPHSAVRLQVFLVERCRVLLTSRYLPEE